MPKATISSFPVSGIFALNKPSGPTSMSIINDVGKLISNSRLFVEESVLNQQEDGEGKKKRRGRGRGKHTNVVKIGQGGTLDPLADGVLGIYW
jgi:tRNA pseudouridine55 synthase